MLTVAEIYGGIRKDAALPCVPEQNYAYKAMRPKANYHGQNAREENKGNGRWLHRLCYHSVAKMHFFMLERQLNSKSQTEPTHIRDGTPRVC